MGNVEADILHVYVGKKKERSLIHCQMAERRALETLPQRTLCVPLHLFPSCSDRPKALSLTHVRNYQYCYTTDVEHRELP